MSGNEKQIEYWNGPVGERWAKLQPTVDVNMASIADALLAFAAPKPGERVLDIGCGGGTTTLLLSKAVGPSGDVTGVDISAPMLAVARGRGIAANFIEADASAHSFNATHDLVFSRFGVMFFDEPVAAFANIRKALKPHGRIAFVCWRPFVENAWSFAPYSAAKSLLPEEPPSDPFAPGPFAFADCGRLRNILDEAGFADIRINPLDSAMHMGADVEEAAMQATRIGPLARAMNGLDDAQREKVRGVVKEVLAKYRTKEGVAPGAACWLVGATV
ncbi:MAG: class I SAM-dependent methyltransferase [Rhizomicrobium sp.]